MRDNSLVICVYLSDVQVDIPKPNPGSNGKKKKKQLVLFSTSMARGGK